MHRRHHHVELRQHLVVQVERAILQNVDFDSGEQTNTGHALLRGANLLDLRERAPLVHPVGDGYGFRMVGERDVFVAELAAQLRPFLRSSFCRRTRWCAFAGRRECRRACTRSGSVSFFRRLDFAGHFAQFGLDVGKLQLGVNFRFGLAGDDLAALKCGQGVFVQRPAHIVRAAAQRRRCAPSIR